MEENRDRAYLQLIHTLLNCPNGDEPQILQDNSELLDRGFLETCESVAAKLAAQGGENGANFLRNLVSQLGQFIDMNDDGDSNNSQGENPQEYANFFLELLQAEEASKGDIKVIYTMLGQRQHLLNARFAETLQQVAQRLLDGENPETISSLVYLIENLSVHIKNFPGRNEANNIEIAIAGYQIVLSNRERGSEKFARTQNNLAVAYSNRINGSRAENLESAIGFYQAALTVYTLEDLPEKWATTQYNLAIAYSDRINGSRAENLESAIGFYQAALTIYTFEDFPEKWAMTQNNLANAYTNRINGSRADNLEVAIGFYEASLTVRTLEDFPEDWAMTQNNLAAGYSDRIKGSRADNLERAIGFYDAALTVRTLEDFPLDWAMTQNNLAATYSNRINGDRAENLELAIGFYEAALTVFTIENFREKWATTQNNLAATYSNRINGSRAENLESAIGFYEAALTVFTIENFREDWAMTQNNLAIAYSNRIKGLPADNLERAIAFYEAALTVRTLEDFPEQWADTQNNLAVAYSKRINGSRAQNLERAIGFSEAALKVRTLEDFPEQWAISQHNLATDYSDRINGSRADNLERAIDFFQATLKVRTLEDFPEQWATTQNNLANAYSNRINGSRADNLERAIAFYEAALTVRTFEDFPEDWAMTQNNLAAAYYARINGSRADNLERAIDLYSAALTVRTLDDFPQLWAETQDNLAITYSDRINGLRSDNLERAIAFYNAALTVRTLEDFTLDHIGTLNNLGWTYLAKLDYINREKPEDTNQIAATLQSAYDTFKNAITGASKLRELESGDETKQKHDLEWDKLYKGMVQVCLDRQSNQEALEYAEANKARNLAEVIAQKQETPQLLKPITFTEITQLLTPDTALIEWYITDKEIITFVVTYPDVLTVHRNRQCDELINLVNNYRADYKQSKTHWQTKLSDYLQRLAEILQITTILPSQSTRLILIPHWLLHLFPLHALPLTDDEFLLDRFTQGIQYSPSCQLLQQITIHPNFDQLLALQNPTSDLPYTDLEVASIAPKFAISQILPGSEASKTNLLEQYLEQLENAHCAHFSCHGSFNADEPLKSFLILSGGIIAEDPVGVVPPCLPQANTEGGHGGTAPTSISEDSVGVVPPCLPLPERYVEWREGKTADIDKCLTLAEIFGLRLKQCRLVVLSACETALIDTQNRSDYIGLPTGFLYAGAMGTLASLWALNDLSTALMMVKFYEVLKPGVSIGQALHDTQRWFKSATTSDLLEWVEGSDSFDGEQKEDVTEYLGRYKLTVKPYGDVYHWGAFCAIGL